MTNLLWRMFSLSIAYSLAFPALVGYAVNKNQRYLDFLYSIRSLTHGIPVGGDLRVSKQNGTRLIFPYREDPNFEDVYLRDVYFPYIPNKEDVIYDIGAHMGFFTVRTARHVKKVISFEPDPRNYRFLKQNILYNDMQNVMLLNYAMGKEDGCLFLKRSYGQGRTSLTELDTGYKVDVRSVDSIVSSIGLNPTVIKIDTEGYEVPILQGAIKSLLMYKPKLLIASYHYPNETKEVIQYLTKMNYLCYIYDVPYTLQKNKESYIYAVPHNPRKEMLP